MYIARQFRYRVHNTNLFITLRSGVIAPSAQGNLARVLSVITALFLASWFPSARSQSNPNLDNGIEAFGSYDTSSFDSIDLATGALSLNIPIMTFPQRGNLPPIKAEIHYASKAFTINGHCVPNNGEPYCEPHWQTSVPFNLSFGPTFLINDGTAETSPTTLKQSPQGNQYSYAVRTADGASHPLLPSPFVSGDYISADGTGYICQSGCTFSKETPPFITYARTGIWTNGSYPVEDPNGNVLTYNVNTLTETDSIDRALSSSTTTTSDLSGCTGDFSTTTASIQDLPGYSSGTTQIKLCYASLFIKSAFNDSTYTDQYGYTTPWKSGSTVTETGGYETVLQSVLMYNGTSWTTSPTWTFHFNNGANGTNTTNYGDVTGITFPTGGTVSYTYGNGHLCYGGISGFVNMSRMVTGRDENANDGSPVVAKTYSGGLVNDGTNDTVHTFGSFGSACQQYETEVQYYSGSGSGRTLLKTVNTDYNSSSDPQSTLYPDGVNRVVGVMPIRVTTTLPSGLVSKVEQDYQTATTSFLDTSYTLTTGNIVQKREYDWASGSPPATPIRCTATTYQSQQNSSYMTANILDLPAIVSVYSGACNSGTLVSQTTNGYDETPLTTSGISVQRDSAASGRTVRGNLTSRQLWVNKPSATISEHNLYYDSGEKYQHTDFKSNLTTYSYDTAYDGAYLTKTQSPSTGSVSHVVSAQYDFNTGLITSYTDENSNKFTYTYDTLLRMTNADLPGGGCVGLAYSSFTSVQKTICMNSTQSIQKTTNFDGLGRLVNTTLSEGGGSSIFTRTAYNAQGQIAQVWNPSRCDQRTASSCSGETTFGSKQFQYDGLGRQTLLIPPGGSATSDNEATSYTGNSVTFTDEAGNQWTKTSDALGRLTTVLEPNGTSTSPSMETDYGYDALDNMVSVTQWGGASGSTGARSRSFSYDSLSRLLSSSNPETGAISYSYVASGALCAGDVSSPCSKTDARNVTTTYTYDALSRLTRKSYSDGTPQAGFGYDGLGDDAKTAVPNPMNEIGRLSQISNDLNAAVTYSYDTMGRLTYQNECLPSDCKYDIPVSAKYDLAGDLTDLTYPDGRHITETWNNSGQLGLSGSPAIEDAAGGAPYVQTVTYAPDETSQILTLGNGVQQSVAKNGLLQMQSLEIANPLAPFSSNTFLSHTYCYVSCTTGGSANNGNLWGITDALNSTKTQGFAYDSLNRLTSFSVGGSANQQYSTDPFGNMSPLSGGKAVATFDPATNRTNNLPCAGSATPYDASGDQTCDTDPEGLVRQYAYDAENRVSQIADIGYTASPYETYLYGADGARVRKTNSGGPFTEYVDFNGTSIAEKDQTGAWTDYIYANGKRIAQVAPNDIAMHFGGTATSTSAAESELFYEMDHYVIKSGDKLSWRQYQGSTAQGGISGMAFFSCGYFNANDTNGQPMGSGSAESVWQERTIDMSSMAGCQFQVMRIGVNSVTATGSFDFWITDMALISSDGTVVPTFHRQPNVTATFYASANVTNPTFAIDSSTVPSGTAAQQNDVSYTLGDHLGTSQMQFSGGGWPVWQGQFAPFGAELDTQFDSDHYKFTGKERDTESGLDYFGARYYGSSMGRFMSPDWAAKPEAVPYSDLMNPQSLNLYGYVNNNPLSKADPDGHCCEEEDPEEEVREGLSFSGEIAEAERQYNANQFNERQQRVNPNATPLSPDQVEAQQAEGNEKLREMLHPNGDILDRINRPIPKPPTGRGLVPPGERDPQRLFSPTQNRRQLERQEGKCARCGEPIEKGEGHHVDRHGDGGRTNEKNHKVVCTDCHVELHRRTPKESQ